MIKQPNLVPITIKVPAEDRLALEGLARKTDRSVSWLLRKYVEQILVVEREVTRGLK